MTAPGRLPGAATPTSRLLAALGGALLAAVTLELVLGQVYRYPLIIDPRFGYSIRPGSTVRWRTEGSGVSRWTVHSVRRPHPPDATPAVLALGDSFTEALMLNDDEVFTTRLEDELRARGRRVQLLNLGKSAMSVADYVHHAPYFQRKFTPRWTVVQLRDSDLTDDAWKSQTGVARFDRQGGRLVVRPPDVSPPTGLKRLLFEPRQRSSLLGYGVVRLHGFAAAAAQEPPLFRAGTPAPVRPTPDLDYPVEEELGLLMRAYQERVSILYLSPYDPLGRDEPSPVERRVAAACARAGWSFVSLRTSFDQLRAARVSPYGFDNTGFNLGHMNAAGHAVAARALAVELERIAGAVF